MSEGNRWPFSDADAARAPGIPARYQRKPPNLRSLKEKPCLSAWENLMECYSIYDFQMAKCAEALFDYNQCAAQNTVNNKKRVSAARFHIKRFMSKVAKARFKR
eukprot:TRINITY_DN8143_c0_g1_i1.p1 TRINITY_DN8143_c0_g1~~TRINITY_DN8143_c0_g1_i1.p1  ORF type:complete len:113 (-),score=15.67 TRINITY_DN8143_c0_g1_i1:78-389(-)